MTGIIWFVQWVHYPLLAKIPVDNVSRTAVQHQQSTGQVVAMPMAVEGVSTLALLAVRPDGVSFIWPWVGALLHAKMATTPTADVGRRLVSTNWPRTLAWSLRMIVCLIMIYQSVSWV